ncbi:MAG: hypothetical protein M0Z30_18360 [Actinomycetota bacterium]|nr:hypothetical protein [Actinomycetota bacterium]
MVDQGLEEYGEPSDPAGRSRRATVAAVALAAGLALAGGGFGIGWAVHGKSHPTAVSLGSAGTGPAASSLADPVQTTGPVGGVLGSATGSAGVQLGVGDVTPNAILLDRRVTSDGITVRTFDGTLANARVSSSRPGCVPTDLVTLELSDTPAVAVESSLVYRPTGSSVTVAGAGAWGVSEHAPAAWALIVTGPAVTSVSVSFAGGITDHAVPVNGIVVVASLLSTSPVPIPTGTVTTTAGGRMSTVPLTVRPWIAADPACISTGPVVSPPSVAPLPAPGVQPADVVLARAGVTQAVEAMYGATLAVQFAHVQGLDPAVENAQKVASGNHPGAQVAATVGSIVFTSPTAAAASYSVRYDGSTVLSDEIAQVVLDQGTWKVTRATACAIYALGGGHC